MGILIYGSPGIEISLDDRALTHLRVVIIAKLRREEKFTFTWQDPESGLTRTLWCHPSIPLQFVQETTENMQLNRAWVEALTSSANSGVGMRLVPEPPSPEPPARRTASA